MRAEETNGEYLSSFESEEDEKATLKIIFAEFWEKNNNSYFFLEPEQYNWNYIDANVCSDLALHNQKRTESHFW